MDQLQEREEGYGAGSIVTETVAGRVRRYSTQGLAQIARQQSIIARLEAQGSDGALTLARSLLATMRVTQRHVETYAAQSEDERRRWAEFWPCIPGINLSVLKSLKPMDRESAAGLAAEHDELRSALAEMDAVNAELAAVNSLLQAANEELRSYAQFLQDSITLIGLDDEMCLVMSTPSARKLFAIQAGDRGRPVTDFTQSFDDREFIEVVRTAMRTGNAIDHEVRLADHQRWLVRIRPINDVAREVDPRVLITFNNISDI